MTRLLRSALAFDISRLAHSPLGASFLRRLAPREPRGARSPEERSQSERDGLLRLLSVSSGLAAVEDSLAVSHFALRREGAVFRPTQSVRQLTPPRAPEVDFSALLPDGPGRGIPAGDVRLSPLLSFVPAQDYLVHAKTGAAFFQVADELQEFLHPALGLLEQKSATSELLPRLLAELGLERGLLSELLGPSVLREAAFFGSDPFLRAGSDVTLLLQPTGAASGKLLRAGLATVLASVGERTGGLTEESLTLEGVSVQHFTSADGAVSAYRATVGETVLLANSAAALTRALRTSQGKSPGLAAEADFRAVVARDAAEPSDVLVFAGERFIVGNVSPETRILDARRSLV